MFDVISIGAGTAGLSAALTLGRSRRRALVASHGLPRNAPAHTAHNLFSRDDISPLALLQIARDQLRSYPSIECRDAEVIAVSGAIGDFTVTFAGGDTEHAAQILIACGVVDVLPEIPGIADLWGGAVFHCPYCHGWEVRERPLAMLGGGEAAVHGATMLTHWSDDVVLLTNGTHTISDHDRENLTRLGVTIRTDDVEAIEHANGDLTGVRFAGGEVLARGGVMIAPAQYPRSNVAETLGCEFEFGRIKVDQMQQTTVPGVYAAGDVATRMQSLANAAFAGSMAGAAMNTYGLHHI